ncbi:28904_t:CDS:1 [Dentiscutata erythropus]|uniref:28904_t:CDS:1 n=1 Tax=Dentiscutata erythropus TaxID=1348616 RepID=A0A9N9AX23_9GLOM|nr:28904_t:CDS:1 [Dentiscutata erythropus]
MNNSTTEQIFCSRCKVNKDKSEFENPKPNQKSGTCDTCRVQSKQYRKNIKLLNKNEILNEILNPNNLADYIHKLFDLYIMENNKENNQLGFHFSCTVDISFYIESSKEIKEITNNLINIVSDVDEYSWI